MSDGLLGHGTSLKVSANTQVTTATTIGNIISISGPNGTREAIKVSTMDSANKYDEFIPGMLDAGEFTAELNYDGGASGTANDLQSLKTNAAQYYHITFPDHTTEASKSDIYCQGFVTALGHAIPYDGKVTQSLTVKLTGAPVYTDAG